MRILTGNHCHHRTDPALLMISNVQSPPKHVIKKERYLTFLVTSGNKFIAGGNYFAKHPKWGSRRLCRKETNFCPILYIRQIDLNLFWKKLGGRAELYVPLIIYNGIV